MKVLCSREVLKNHIGVFCSLVAEQRRERDVKYVDFDAPDEHPGVAESSDDEDGQPPTDDEAEAKTLSAKAEAPPTGTYTRWLGLDTFEGRGQQGAVRVRKRAHTAPTISPELWKLSTATRKWKL